MKEKWNQIVDELWEGFTKQFSRGDILEYEESFIKLAREIHLEYLYEVCPQGAIYCDPAIIDATRGITYRDPKLTTGFMKKPKKIRVKEQSLMDLIPKVKAPKFKYKIKSIT